MAHIDNGDSAAANYFANQYDKNGTYSVQKVRLNSQLYELAKRKLKILDQTSAGIEMQNQRETRQKVKIINAAIFTGIK